MYWRGRVLRLTWCAQAVRLPEPGRMQKHTLNHPSFPWLHCAPSQPSQVLPLLGDAWFAFRHWRSVSTSISFQSRGHAALQMCSVYIVVLCIPRVLYRNGKLARESMAMIASHGQEAEYCTRAEGCSRERFVGELIRQAMKRTHAVMEQGSDPE